MANERGAFGLEPFGPILRQQVYSVLATNATAIAIGDPVALGAAGTVDLVGAGGSTNPLLGGVVGIYKDGAPIKASGNYGSDPVPATCGSGYEVVVANDPQQLWLMREDSVGGALAATAKGSNIQLVAGTLDSVTGISGWMLDSSLIAVTATHQMRLVEPAPLPNNAIGDYCLWICMVNFHQMAMDRVGI